MYLIEYAVTLIIQYIKCAEKCNDTCVIPAKQIDGVIISISNILWKINYQLIISFLYAVIH